MLESSHLTFWILWDDSKLLLQASHQAAGWQWELASWNRLWWPQEHLRRLRLSSSQCHQLWGKIILFETFKSILLKHIGFWQPTMCTSKRACHLRTASMTLHRIICWDTMSQALSFDTQSHKRSYSISFTSIREYYRDLFTAVVLYGHLLIHYYYDYCITLLLLSLFLLYTSTDCCVFGNWLLDLFIIWVSMHYACPSIPLRQ